MSTALFLAGGLVLLWASSERFVTGAARIARKLDISPIVVGAVVIGFGTSLPEALVSGLAAIEGYRQIALGNVVGSNLANLTLILGILGLLATPRVSAATLRQEIPVSTASIVILALLLQKGLTRTDGIVLLAGLMLILIQLVRIREKEPQPAGPPVVPEADPEVEAISVGRESLWVLVGLVGTIAGAQLLVTGAHSLAETLGLAEGFVGLTIVAVGTSLPELASSVQAVRQGAADLALGNILGSNLFNSFAIGGLIGVISPGPAAPEIAGLATLAMTLAALGVGWFLWTGKRLVRWEAVALLAAYALVIFLTAR